MGSYDYGRYGEPWEVSLDYITTDSDVVIKAAPGALKTLVMQKICLEVYTASAQTVTIGDGTTDVKISGNSAGHHEFDWGAGGQAFAVNTAISISSSAGPGIALSAFGYIKSTTG